MRHAKPAVDHYVGYKLVELVVPASGHEWGLRFDQKVLVKNHDPDKPDAPDGAEGLSLLSVDYNEGDTTLNFGSLNPDGTPNFAATVVFTPELYSISQPGSEEVFPQVVIEAEAPNDPSDIRVADGPENP